MGGSFSDNSGSMLLFERVNADEVRALMDDDPFIANGVFALGDVWDWTVFVDKLSPS
jgi:uncharacterized protein YciI